MFTKRTEGERHGTPALVQHNLHAWKQEPASQTCLAFLLLPLVEYNLHGQPGEGHPLGRMFAVTLRLSTGGREMGPVIRVAEACLD